LLSSISNFSAINFFILSNSSSAIIHPFRCLFEFFRFEDLSTAVVTAFHVNVMPHDLLPGFRRGH
jgi:hypothetical protein